jgi:hypothetical protein
MFELLREKRHEAVNKAVQPKVLARMSKKDKVKLGRLLGPQANTVTEVINWISTTHLAKIGIPKKPESLMNKNNGVIKPKDPEAIAKASKEKRDKQKQSGKKNAANNKKKSSTKDKGKIQKKKLDKENVRKEKKAKKEKKVKAPRKTNRGNAPPIAT